MEPVTHVLASIAIGRAGLNKVVRAATPMLVVSGLIADADWVTRLGGAAAFLHGHRTVTHSLMGSAMLAALVTAGFCLAGRKFPKLTIRFVPALLVCAVGAGVHLLLDLCNDYGEKLLWPFSGKWYALDLVNSVDAWILFFLLAGLLLPELFHLVLEEIGSKPRRHGRQRGAIVALVLVATFIGGRALARQRALALLGSREYRNQPPLEIGAFPLPSNPLVWSGVVETDSALFNQRIPLAPASAFDPGQAEVHFKPQADLALENAQKNPVAIDFLSYARFPLASVQPRGDGFQVKLRDMRFASELPGHRGIVAVIDLNAQSLVTGARLEFDSREAF